MDIARRFRRGRWPVAWRHQVAGVLWRLVPDHDGGVIGEVRDPAAKRASFFRVKVSGGEMLWRDVDAPGGWWTGIECVLPGVLLLHGFASPDLPGHRGLTALDVRTGATLWSDDEMVFVAAAYGAAYGLRGRPERRELAGRDVRTGAVGSVEPPTDARLLELAKKWRAEAAPPCDLPGPVDAGSESNAGVAALRAGSPMVDGAVESLRVGDAVVIAHHEMTETEAPAKPLYRRVLSVFAGDAPSVVFREVLDENLTMPVPEAFLVVDHTLLFVTDRRILSAVDIPGAARRG
jgi:hypothetical protein